MKIAVVIVNFNSGDLLTTCIEHLECQTRAADTIVVVDNASQDSSLEPLLTNDSIQILRLDDNQGFAAANNRAFEQLPDADYFITLNPDAFAAPDFIKNFEQAARANPNHGSFASRMMLNEDTLDGAGDIYHLSGLAWRWQHKQPYTANHDSPREPFSPCAGAAMYRSQDILDLQGFDESLFCYMEDVDLGYRMLLQGKRCLYVPDAVVTHMGSAISNQYPGFAAYHGHRNLVWVMLKNTPTPLLLLVLPAHLAMTVLVGLYFLLQGQIGIYLKAKRDALRGLGSILGKRREIQGTKTLGSWQVLRALDISLWR